MTTDGSLEETDQLVDDVIADLLKVTENSGPEEYLGVADAVAVLVNGRAEDDLRDLLVVFHGQLRTLKETNSDQLCHTFFVSLTKRENCLQKMAQRMWRSGRFLYHKTRVQIQPAANFIEHFNYR